MKLKGLKEMKNENNKRDFISGDLCIIVNKPFMYVSHKQVGKYRINYFYEIQEETNSIYVSEKYLFEIKTCDKCINPKIKNTYCNFWVCTETNYKKIKNILRRLLRNGKSK